MNLHANKYRYSKYDDVRVSFCIQCRTRLEHLECPKVKSCTGCKKLTHQDMGICLDGHHVIAESYFINSGYLTAAYGSNVPHYNTFTGIKPNERVM